MADLKPCPFCGGEASHWYCSPDGKHTSNVGGKSWGQECSHHIIRCKKCGTRTKVYATRKSCYNAWQRRTKVETNIHDNPELLGGAEE